MADIFCILLLPPPLIVLSIWQPKVYTIDEGAKRNVFVERVLSRVSGCEYVGFIDCVRGVVLEPRKDIEIEAVGISSCVGVLLEIVGSPLPP